MEKERIGLSLRYKLLIVMTILPIVTLSLYLVMATRLFEQDKIAYVHDSSVTVSRSLATRVRSEISASLAKIKPVVEGYDYTLQKFTPIAKELFANEPLLEGLVLYQAGQSGQYEKIGGMGETPLAQTFLNDSANLGFIREQAKQHRMTFRKYHPKFPNLIIGHRLGSLQDHQHLLVVYLYRANSLIEDFGKSALYKSFLLDRNGQVALSPEDQVSGFLKGEKLSSFFRPALESETPEGSLEVQTGQGEAALLSYVDTGLGNLLVASVVEKKSALKAVDLLVAKSIVFFIALLAATLVVSIVASVRLTSTLRDLYEATKKIAQGQFDVSINSRSNDEVGGLARSFNWMAKEVSRLMEATAESARMESELATVRVVQETLFPAPESRFGPFRVVGHYEPASECGGDWWNYSQVGSKIYLWIGDATGHGAPAALITSAAKSAASIIELMPDMSPGQALEIMNKAIHETSKGEILMTFFLACIDLETNQLTYANASHDPPYLIRPKDGPLSKKDLVPLMDVVGARLGEQKDSKYEEKVVDLQEGDLIFFYTDGVIDVENPDGRPWGERSFLKAVIGAVAQGKNADEKLNELRGRINEYRGESDLIDDITLFMCQFERTAA